MHDVQHQVILISFVQNWKSYVEQLLFLHIWSFIFQYKFSNLALLRQLPQWCLCPWVHCLLLSQFSRPFLHQYWQHSEAFALELLLSLSCFRLQSVVGQCTNAMVFTNHFGNGVNFSTSSSLLALSGQVNGISITIRLKLDHAHNDIRVESMECKSNGNFKA